MNTIFSTFIKLHLNYINSKQQLTNEMGVNFITLCQLLFARGRYKAKYFLSIIAVLFTVCS